MTLYLKLRNNISLEGDIQLAKREVEHLFGKVIEVSSINWGVIPKFVNNACKISNIRKGNIIGYVVDEPKVSIKQLVKLLSFIQEIWCEAGLFPPSDYSADVENSTCIIPMMAMSEFLSFFPNLGKTSSTEIVKALANIGTPSKNAIKSISRVNTSSPHIHSFHKYKAKFFPRFVRSLIVSNLNLDTNELTICDPYVGSGTTLIESSLLGYKSFGYDIDPLSCFISEVKSRAIDIKINDLCIPSEDLIPTPSKCVFSFPTEIAKKFERWNKFEEREQYEKEISKELDLIEQETGFYKQLHQIALSDALTRKFNIRMMGTGSGRFALEIGSKSLKALINSNIKTSINALKTIELLKDIYNITSSSTAVYNGNATNRTCEDNSCDIIVTSPPYLPASSGRENYLIGKITSLTALDLLKDKDSILSNSVGSMTNDEDLSLDKLPQSVSHLYQWLLNDELRKIKATPIVAYYNSIRKSLLEDKRTIKNKGKIIYIIGKESVFYSNTTKEILYRVDCDKIFIEIAKSTGLKIDEVINIELNKKDAVARPRSSDKYYETAIIMSK
ncbi:MAG TPA: site-specific DNA-methyltransferase [Candidatus Phocaeicola gallistercoris]|nr:site-specific DNA-methyltransferase [Candidatus Phocaeicola gallistercoris]